MYPRLKLVTPAASYSQVAAEYYDSARHPTCRNFREASLALIQGILKKCALETRRICDVGAGDSVVAEILLNNGNGLSSLYALDASVEMLRYSIQYASRGARLIVGDTQCLPFESQSLDIMVSSLGDPYNTASFWSEVSRTLKADAICFFTTPSFEWATKFRQTAIAERKDHAFFELKTSESVYLPSIVLPTHEQSALIKDSGLKLVAINSFFVSDLESNISPKLRLNSENALEIVTGYLVAKER